MVHAELATLLQPVTAAAGRWVGDSWDELPGFVLAFGALFLGALAFWRWAVRLPMEKAALLSSCTMSSFHGTVVSIYGLLLLRELESFSLDRPSTPGELLLTQFSFAYIIADFIFYLMPFTPNDYVFIVHHFISGFYVVGVLLHGVSAIGCILMFWMGEITSPLFNTFTISRELRHLSKAAFQIFSLAGPLFTVSFLLVRSVVAPPMVAWFVHTLWFRTSALPLVWRAPMGACVVLGIVGSQLWSYKLILGYRKQKQRRALQAAAKAA